MHRLRAFGSDRFVCYLHRYIYFVCITSFFVCIVVLQRTKNSALALGFDVLIYLHGCRRLTLYCSFTDRRIEQC